MRNAPMSASKTKLRKSETKPLSRDDIALRAMRKAQRLAIKEDLRYGLKPVLATPKKK